MTSPERIHVLKSKAVSVSLKGNLGIKRQVLSFIKQMRPSARWKKKYTLRKFTIYQAEGSTITKIPIKAKDDQADILKINMISLTGN